MTTVSDLLEDMNLRKYQQLHATDNNNNNKHEDSKTIEGIIIYLLQYLTTTIT